MTTPDQFVWIYGETVAQLLATLDATRADAGQEPTR